MSLSSLFRVLNLSGSAKLRTISASFTFEPGFPISVLGSLLMPHHPLHFRFLHEYRDWDASTLRWSVRGSPKRPGLKPRTVRSYCMRRFRTAFLLSLAQQGYDTNGKLADNQYMAQLLLNSRIAEATSKTEVRLGLPGIGTDMNLQLDYPEPRLRWKEKPALYGYLDINIQSPSIGASFGAVKQETDRLVKVLIDRVQHNRQPSKRNRPTGLEILHEKRGLYLPRPLLRRRTDE